MPVAVHQALAAFDVRKAEIVNGEVNRMREQTQLMNGYEAVCYKVLCITPSV